MSEMKLEIESDLSTNNCKCPRPSQTLSKMTLIVQNPIKH